MMLSDRDIVVLIKDGNLDAFRHVMLRYNQRLFRIIRGVLKNEHEIEDIIQETYFKAYSMLHTLDNAERLGAWLGKIAINESLMRLRRKKIQRESDVDVSQLEMSHTKFHGNDPTSLLERHELHILLEEAIDRLPDDFRLVFILRAIEQMSVSETARYLNIHQTTVKTRFFRAKRLLRKSIETKNRKDEFFNVFEFGGDRCNAIVEAVLSRLQII